MVQPPEYDPTIEQGTYLESPEPSKVPTAKVTSALAAGALATVVAIIVQSITHHPAPAGLEGGLATIFAFLGGYIAPRN